MKIAERSSPFGYTIFCDDIRVENSGKLMFIGTYSGMMFVRSPLPVALSKIAMQVNYCERPNESSEPVELRVYLPDSPENEPHIRVPLPIEEMRSRPLLEPSPGSEQWLTAIAHIEISPLQLNTEGLIKVRAYRGDLEVRLGSLRVQHVPQETPANEPPVSA